MNSSTVALLRFTMWFVCIFHIGVGLALNLDIGLKEWVATSLYGAHPDWSDAQFVYILKPLGAFMISLGVIAAIAARDPLGQRGIVYAFSLLFALRALQRLVFLGESSRAFAIAPGRTIGAMVAMVALALLLLYLARAAGPTVSSRRGAAAA